MENRKMMDNFEKVKGWNWGAFVFNVWWGIGNKCYLPLLCLIPGFGVIWMFVCGAKGNEWAYNNCGYDNTTVFQLVQKAWNRAGLVCFILTILIIAGMTALLYAMGITLTSYIPHYPMGIGTFGLFAD